MKSNIKLRTNVSIDEQLLLQARAEHLVLSTLLENAIRIQLKKSAQERWQAENKDAIEAYNNEIENEGTFSDGLRSF